MARSLLVLAAGLVLAACSTGGNAGAEALAAAPPPPEMRQQEPIMIPDEPEARCDADRAQWAVGRPATEALLRQAKEDAGVEIARFIPHDMMVTMEYHPSRLNIDLDEDGRVRMVRCG